MEKHIQLFLDDIHALYPSLINSFVYYYGEEYKDRIVEVLNSITFIVRDEYYNFVGSNNESRMNQIDVIKQENPKFKKSIESSHSCVVHKEQPPVIIIPYMNPIKMHTLIHEINHTLHNKLVEDESYSLISIGPKKMKCIEGIPSTDNNQTFYEILNEYMTYDIMEHYKNKHPNDPSISLDFDYINYVFVDDYLDYSIKDLYSVWRNQIADYLIKGEGEALKELFGPDEYDDVDSMCSQLFEMANEKAENQPNELQIKQSLKQIFINNPTINLYMAMTGQAIEDIIKKVPNL